MRRATHRHVGLASPVVHKLQNDDRLMAGGHEDGAFEDGDESVDVVLGDPDVAAAVRKPLRVRVHAQLHLGPEVADHVELEKTSG